MRRNGVIALSRLKNHIVPFLRSIVTTRADKTPSGRRIQFCIRECLSAVNI